MENIDFINLRNHLELINPKIQIKDVKKIIKDITGIKKKIKRSI